MYAQLRRRLDHKDDAGFTLIELLMVVVILAVLAAVVVFSVSGFNNTSKQSACQAQVATVNTAAEAYYAQNNAGATTWAELSPAFIHEVPSSLTETDIATGFTLVYGGGAAPGGYTITFTKSATGAGNAVGTGAC